MVDTAYLGEVAGSLLLVLGLVVLNGFFVAAEFAIVKIRLSQLEALPRGPRREAAHHAATHLDAYLSACQVGITIASLALGWVGEPAVSHLLIEPLLGPHLDDPETLRGISFGVAFFVITALHIIIGELAPKSIAIQRAQGTALWVALPLRFARKLFAPLIWMMNGSANLLLRVVGLHTAASDEHAYSIDEIRVILAQVPAKEKSQRRSAVIASRIFSLHDIRVGEIMIPRDKMVCVDIQRPFDHNLAVVKKHRFTRFLLVDGSPDSVLGFVHQRDVFQQADEPEARLSELRRPLSVAPTTHRASTLLFEMLEKRRQMAVVTDEYGMTAGLITLEDLLEQFMGEIPGEFDKYEDKLRVIAPNLYRVDGAIPLHELQLVLREPLTDKQAATLSALLTRRLQRTPRRGDQAKIGNYEYTVVEADPHRVHTVEIRRSEEGAATGPDLPLNPSAS